MAKASFQRTDDALYETLMQIRSKDECIQLMQDICSPTELSAIEQRFEIARMLMDGAKYRDIAVVTGASSATISRTNRLLQDGAEGLKATYGRIKKKK